MDLFRKQAHRFQATTLFQDVTKVDFSRRPFRLWTQETEYSADAVIIEVTGSEDKIAAMTAATRPPNEWPPTRSRAGAKRSRTDATTARHDDGRGGERDARDALHAIRGQRVELGEVEAAFKAIKKSVNEKASAKDFLGGEMPLDLDGAYDERSDRQQTLDELMEQGYHDAYRLFIEPLVGGSGERVGQTRE